MSSDIKIPKISQKHLLGIKYLSVEDINKILELGIFFKLKNKEKNKNYPILTGRTVINLFFEPSTRTSFFAIFNLSDERPYFMK